MRAPLERNIGGRGCVGISIGVGVGGVDADRLPRDQRDVVMLRFFAGRSIRETSETLGRSEGAIKQLQFRALASLRRRTRR